MSSDFSKLLKSHKHETMPQSRKVKCYILGCTKEGINPICFLVKNREALTELCDEHLNQLCTTYQVEYEFLEEI